MMSGLREMRFLELAILSEVDFKAIQAFFLFLRVNFDRKASLGSKIILG